MSTKVTIWGTNGRLTVDRQEVQLFLRENLSEEPGFEDGWNILYATDLMNEVWYYLRGEEYSAQIDHFIRCIETRHVDTISSFASATATDQIVSMMLEDSGATVKPAITRTHRSTSAVTRRHGFLGRVRALLA